MTTRILAGCLALGLLVGSADAKPKKKPVPFPNITVERQSGTTIPFLGIPLNQKNESYSVNKNGVQYKRAQGDWVSGSRTTTRVGKDGKIKIQQKDSRLFPW
jgi:hypothetical protein